MHMAVMGLKDLLVLFASKLAAATLLSASQSWKQACMQSKKNLQPSGSTLMRAWSGVRGGHSMTPWEPVRTQPGRAEGLQRDTTRLSKSEVRLLSQFFFSFSSCHITPTASSPCSQRPCALGPELALQMSAHDFLQAWALTCHLCLFEMLSFQLCRCKLTRSETVDECEGRLNSQCMPVCLCSQQIL